MADAEAIRGADQGQVQQLGLALDFGQEVGVGQLEIFDGGIFAVDQAGESEAVDESFDFAGGHGFLSQIDELNGGAALLEKAFGGAGSLRIFYAEDLDGHS